MKANTFIQSVLGHTNIKSVTSDEIKLLIQQSQPNLNLNNEMLISKILEEFQKVDKISKNNFKRFINKMCGLSKTTSSPTSVVYWICMGWSDEEGKKKKDLYCQSGTQVCKQYHEKCKENPSLYQKNSRMCLEYWTSRGYSENEAKQNISDVAKHAGGGLNEYLKQNPNKQTTKIEYWLEKGYSLEEATEKLKNRQATFSYDKCIKKYGEEKGYVIWLERQNKWKQSLYDIGYWVYKDKTQKNAFQTYKEKVWSFTKLQPLSSLPNFEKRGQCIESSYHLDHIMSIWDGFELGIEPKIIGNIVNLRFIPARENLSKHKESHYSKEQLLKLYEEYHGRK